MSRQSDQDLYVKIMTLISEHPGESGKVLKSFSINWKRAKLSGFTLAGFSASWKFPPKTKKP